MRFKISPIQVSHFQGYCWFGLEKYQFSITFEGQKECSDLATNNRFGKRTSRGFRNTPTFHSRPILMPLKVAQTWGIFQWFKINAFQGLANWNIHELWADVRDIRIGLRWKVRGVSETSWCPLSKSVVCGQVRTFLLPLKCDWKLVFFQTKPTIPLKVRHLDRADFVPQLN